ncbi:MAG: adenosylmethionine--8-amino-7-oxononanoate transaminase [Rickettsiales bacterium]|nr:adenosylmethionine--8-amino-7-oxononanoate transaminase [Rickettsiales bacterium]
MSKNPDWLDEGWQHIWLPYAQMQTTPHPLPVASAVGSTITLNDGTTLIDGIASWWSMCHGYQHPAIVKAITDQAQSLSHVMFAGLANEPAYRLSAKLAELLPAPLDRVFFSDSGSTAVEVALKMALQYWRNKDQTKKSKFITFNHAYHGDTFGAMSVSGRGGMHSAFDSLTSKHFIVDIPNDEYSVAEFEETVADIAPLVAGLIVEPLVQGAGGMRFYSADVLAEIRRVCREHDILFIADEVMTGFGRTGSMFAFEEAGIVPDIVCLGKGLTGGHIPLAATVASDTIFEAFLDDSLDKALMHGPTFMGNPLGCAAALASLELFESEDRLKQVEAIEKQMRSELAPCKKIDGVLDVRVRGALGVVKIDASQEDMFPMRQEFLKHGVWLRPFSNVVYLAPPFVISTEELNQVTQAIQLVLEDWSKKREAS